MKIWGIAVLVIATFSLACNKGSVPGIQGSGASKSETRNLSGFKKIKAENAMNLDVSVQNAFSVSVEADDNLMPNISTEVKGDTLVISLKDKASTKTKVNIKIAMPELTALDLTGATTATVTGVKSDDFKIDANGASKIKIDGEAKTLKAKALGASSIDAENLKTGKAEADSVGASTITVTASDELKADATGASTILYVGDPRSLKQNAADVSTIKKK